MSTAVTPPVSVPGARSGTCGGLAAREAHMEPKTTRTAARRRRSVLIQLSRCRIDAAVDVDPSRPVARQATLRPCGNAYSMVKNALRVSTPRVRVSTLMRSS
jgi:hypothetical protein